MKEIKIRFEISIRLRRTEANRYPLLRGRNVGEKAKGI